MEFKTVAYRGFIRAGDSEVTYVIHGKNIYYTGLHRNRTSTINAAENVVGAICEAEKIGWRDYTFHDVVCQSCYKHYKPGEFRIAQLQLEPNERSFRVIFYRDVAISPGIPAPEGFVSKVEPGVIATFRPFIGSPNPTEFPPEIRDVASLFLN